MLAYFNEQVLSLHFGDQFEYTLQINVRFDHCADHSADHRFSFSPKRAKCILVRIRAVIDFSSKFMKE